MFLLALNFQTVTLGQDKFGEDAPISIDSVTIQKSELDIPKLVITEKFIKSKQSIVESDTLYTINPQTMGTNIQITNYFEGKQGDKALHSVIQIKDLR